MSKYPECEKMSAVKDKSQEIGSFIDWLASDKQVYLANKSGYPVRTSMEKLLAEYYDIDLKKVEEERRQILEDMQKGNIV